MARTNVAPIGEGTMASFLEGVDLKDPCAVLEKLREAEMRLALGENVVVTQFGADRTEWQRADGARLAEIIKRVERLCEQKSGRPRRHAIRAGFLAR